MRQDTSNPIEIARTKYCEASTLIATLIPDTMIRLKKKTYGRQHQLLRLSRITKPSTMKISTTPSNENNMVCRDTGGKPMR
ncbi:hypothetical protein OK016_23030 [Vibrio chagasii]|nr:hypothetical protein [Vibrio chagasii]